MKNNLLQTSPEIPANRSGLQPTLEVLVPEGHHENSPAFQRWDGGNEFSSPEGTTESSAANSNSAVPSGLTSQLAANPALKRRAIIECPSGTSAINPVLNFRSAFHFRHRKPFRPVSRVFTFAALAALLPTSSVSAQTNHATLDHQHVDIRILYDAAATNKLSLVVRNSDAGINYSSNQVVLNVNEPAKYILDFDFPPFGNTGDSIWILPASQESGLLYLGLSAEGIAPGIFNGPLTIQLKAMDGPGHFFLWQSSAFGEFNIKMNTRDGISTNDQTTPIIGSHEHMNWGFTKSGWYYVTLQVSGRRVGETTNILSLDTTFVFHVLPLKPFEQWQEANWLFAMPRSITSPEADPDGDSIVNILEYAFGNDPKVALRTNLPTTVFTSIGGTNFGALRYCRNTNATDLIFAPVTANGVADSTWSNLTNIVSDSTNGMVQTVIARDSLPANETANRFYQLRVTPF